MQHVQQTCKHDGNGDGTNMISIVLYALCHTSVSPQWWPVYYLLTQPGCSILMFLCGMQVWLTARQYYLSCHLRSPLGKVLLSLTVGHKRIWTDLHSEKIGNVVVGIEVMLATNSSSHWIAFTVFVCNTHLIIFSFTEHVLPLAVMSANYARIIKWSSFQIALLVSFHCWVRDLCLSGPHFVLSVIDICFCPRLSDN